MLCASVYVQPGNLAPLAAVTAFTTATGVPRSSSATFGRSRL